MAHYLVTIARGWDVDLVRGILVRVGRIDDVGCEHIPRLVNLRTRWRPEELLTIEGVESAVPAETPVAGADQSLTWQATADHSTKDNVALAMLSWPAKLLGPGHVPADSDLSYDFDRDGSGVDIYLVDAEVPISLPHFAGRVTKIFDAHNAGPGEHAAMMCGPLNTAKYGAAKGALVRNAVALSPSASGSVSSLIAAMNACLSDYAGRAATDRPAVMNISIGAAPTFWGADPLGAATDAVLDAGILIFAAAMNHGRQLVAQNRRFPAAHLDTIGVGNCLADERRAADSNYGNLVEIYACGGSREAPDGEALSSTTYSVLGAGRLGLGTSSATPHVTAAAACLLTGYKRLRGRPDAMALRAAILWLAASGRVTGVPVGPTRVAHKPAVLGVDPLGIPDLWFGLGDDPEPPPDLTIVSPPPTDAQFVESCIAAGGFLTFVGRSHL